jgi:hypothetical protein
MSPQAPRPKAKDKDTEPTDLEYIYDWQSIFANPEQAMLFGRPDEFAETRKGFAEGGTVGDYNGAKEAAEILGKSVEEITPEDIDFAADMVAQQMVLSGNEIQYDEPINDAVDFATGGMLQQPKKISRDTYTDELLKLLGDK